MRREHLFIFLAVLTMLLAGGSAHGLVTASRIQFSDEAGAFPLVSGGNAVPLHVGDEEDKAVFLAVEDFRADIARVTGIQPDLHAAGAPFRERAVIVGTIGTGGLVDRLVEAGKVDPGLLSGKWETYLIEVVDEPFAGVREALVIAGSDRRGTIYGLYTLSEQMGVSPWYWWADVPVNHREAIHLSRGRTVEGPAIRYRGIFLNDEAPALAGWAREKFGGFNHEFYGKVFELILRLRGNYLWPAMWGSAFADDDPLNPILADERGIVMGTSHHEPMMRAHDEWRRYGSGPWDYARNAERLRGFWRTGLERTHGQDKIITIGMRGDGDEAMSEEANISLLERIVDDQRAIIGDVEGLPPEEVPQVWALYKEVQEYYEKGMRVPDDVTLLWCDDNWGNIRRLPLPEERARPGGAGVYYHFDYVGGPRNYKWINVTPIGKVWEQMHLAWEYEARKIWIVNVGDLKPMEFPMEFFLTYAWDPEAWPYERLGEYKHRWAERDFGSEQAGEIAFLVNEYARLNRRRTPELFGPSTLSLVNYREAERVLDEWDDLKARAAAVRDELPAVYHDAFFQLVQYPVLASANLRELYVTVGYNRLYADQGRVATNRMADRVETLFRKDRELAQTYHTLGGGKWNHFMSQIKFGYQIWQQPPAEVMPAVHRMHPRDGPVMAIALEGAPHSWPETYAPEAKLPPLDPHAEQARWIDVFNRGDEPFEFEVTGIPGWMRVRPASGIVEEQIRLEVTADWSGMPLGNGEVSLIIRGAGSTQTVLVPIENPVFPRPGEVSGYTEVDGYIAIDAPLYSRVVSGNGVEWKQLPRLGRTGGSMTVFPVTAPDMFPDGEAPRIEYDLFFRAAGEITIEMHLGPSLDFQEGNGLRFGLSFNDEKPRIYPVDTWQTLQTWEKAVADSVHVVKIKDRVEKPGRHTLKIWNVTPGVLFQRIIIDTGGLRESYLGPPTSPFTPEGVGNGAPPLK